MWSALLLIGGRRRELAGAWGEPAGDTHAHTQDGNLRRFVLAGACAPIFLHGAVKQSNNNEVTKAGLNKWRTCTLTRVPKEGNNAETLGAALGSIGLRVSGYHKAGGDKALVELAPDTRSHDAVLDALDKGVHTGAAPVVADMCYDICIYVYMYRYIYIYTHTHMSMYIYTKLYIGGRRHVLRYMYICIYIYRYIYTHTHTHVYVYIYKII